MVLAKSLVPGGESRIDMGKMQDSEDSRPLTRRVSSRTRPRVELDTVPSLDAAPKRQRTRSQSQVSPPTCRSFCICRDKLHVGLSSPLTMKLHPQGMFLEATSSSWELAKNCLPALLSRTGCFPALRPFILIINL